MPPLFNVLSLTNLMKGVSLVYVITLWCKVTIIRFLRSVEENSSRRAILQISNSDKFVSLLHYVRIMYLLVDLDYIT
jgi:hypothetical protein